MQLIWSSLLSWDSSQRRQAHAFQIDSRTADNKVAACAVARAIPVFGSVGMVP